MSAAPVVEVRDLVIQYASGGYSVRPIDGLDLDAQRGRAGRAARSVGVREDLVAVRPRRDPPADGGHRPRRGTSVEQLSGTAMSDYRQRTVGFVFQAFNLVPSLTARENVAIPLLLAGVRRSTAMARADELLAARGPGRPRRASGPTSSPAASSSASRSPAGWPRTHRSSWPTNPPPTSTTSRRRGSSRSCATCEPTAAPSSSPPTTTASCPIADRVIHLVPEHRTDVGAPRLVNVAAGEVVFEQGDRGELVYVIEAGHGRDRAHAHDGTDEELAALGRGGVLRRARARCSGSRAPPRPGR